MNKVIAIRAQTIYTPTQAIEEGVVLIEGPRICAVGTRDEVPVPADADIAEFPNGVVTPGFIDLHIHGAGGRDLMESTDEAVIAVGSYLACHGTTSFLATTITAGLDRTVRAVRGLARLIQERGCMPRRAAGLARSVQAPSRYAGQGQAIAEPLGIHFEGPFLSVLRRGAHPPEHTQLPCRETLRVLLEAAQGTARVITLAPELEGALDLLRHAIEAGLKVAIGHSDATYEQAEAAIDAGATDATHAFNAMRPFSHRDPGILGAVLTDDRVSAELICDGIHVHGPAVRLLAKAKGTERVLLVTDCVSPAGMPEGEYGLGDLRIRLSGGVCQTLEGTLAGSTLTLDRALNNLCRFTGLNFGQCLTCATLNPARLLGLEKQKGAVAPGADADLVVLDANYRVLQTYVRGQAVNRAIG